MLLPPPSWNKKATSRSSEAILPPDPGSSSTTSRFLLLLLLPASFGVPAAKMIGVSARVPQPRRQEGEHGGAEDGEDRWPLSNRHTSSVNGSTSARSSSRESAAPTG